ncbi:putative FYVE zinc finger Ras family [Trypanosoma vivax]|uniref:FYVE-type domain-containing protein n=1 Tax=Trypanosoma vivax (strain Y486) TaxID=1055687 RepID=G0TYJ4_TRYVY|nr:hypothetical protein TRVL_02222 [Trypanosoma vivax]KAH8611880.1 putative FYVE zinc finger Ras family [Trypanosoma vivax]CCC49041.1 conserved hypothetical protein [Trypanosoma vivax Y486]
MDYMDFASARETGPLLSPATISVSIPYTTAAVSSSSSNTCNSSVSGNGNDNGVTSSTCLSSSGTIASHKFTRLTKPTLDPSHIRFCPPSQWVPDAQIMTCMTHECNVFFSFFNRRHHCHICGRVFCSACCSRMVNLGDYPRMSSPNSRSDGMNGVHLNAVAPQSSVRTSVASSIFSPRYAPQREFQSQQLACSTSVPGSCRICTSCHYETQLVVSRRGPNGGLRRKCRGELKMIQWSLLVRILSFLPMEDLLEVSLVSSDFYFMSRDNVIWLRHNMSRFAMEKEIQRTVMKTVEGTSALLKQNSHGRQRREIPFSTDIDDIVSADALKPSISLNARYNFTQFLDFTRRQETTRCKGLSCFAVGAHTLLSSPLKVALIGPCGARKTLMMQHLVPFNQHNGRNAGSEHSETQPTASFQTYEKAIHVTGGLTADARLQVFDISGEKRFRELRRLICLHCHAIGLCYDPQSRTSFMEAVDMIQDLVSALGPQPVVLCGVLPQASTMVGRHDVPPLEVGESETQDVGEWQSGSLRCPYDRGDLLFQRIVQCLLDRIALATSVVSFNSPSNSSCIPNEGAFSVTNHTAAHELLKISTTPSPIDVLIN